MKLHITKDLLLVTMKFDEMVQLSDKMHKSFHFYGLSSIMSQELKALWLSWSE